MVIVLLQRAGMFLIKLQEDIHGSQNASYTELYT
jgi:hypothetical protein